MFGMRYCVCLPVVVDVRVPAYTVLVADVQIVPQAAVQHHVSHHPDPVFNLKGETEKYAPSKRTFRCVRFMTSSRHETLPIDLQTRLSSGGYSVRIDAINACRVERKK